MSHDQLFKQFLREFLRDFLRLFYPEIAARLDFRRLRFLDTESFTSCPEGSSRAADLVAEVQTRDGTPEILLIHVEVQARRRSCFPKRMFQYYALLWAKHEVPIFPVVVYLRGGRTGLSEEEYLVELFGREQLRFRYAAVALARLEAREYVGKASPVAAALAALMCRRPAREPVQLRLSMMERLARSSLDEARKFLLLHMIETYFMLASADRKKLNRELSRKRYRKVRKMQLTWVEKMEEKGRKEGVKKGRQQGRQEGRQEGRKEGLVEGKQAALLRQLKTKFGPLPEETIVRVRAVQSLRELDRYLDRVLVASSLADMGVRG